MGNPQDFPISVFIRKGLWRDTPQLIYINVGKHIKPKTKLNKIPGIKILIALPILFLTFLFLLNRPWDNPSLKEIYLENYKSQKIGIIEKLELFKGCGLSVKFENPNRKYISFKKDTLSYSLGNGCELIKQIHPKDYFQKLPESNQCFIIRNDSIMLFDCNTAMEKELTDSIENLKKWNIKGQYEWKKMPYKPIEKYLTNEQYEKYKSEK